MKPSLEPDIEKLNYFGLKNEVLATCQTNIQCLLGIKASLDKSQQYKSAQYAAKLNCMY